MTNFLKPLNDTSLLHSCDAPAERIDGHAGTIEENQVVELVETDGAGVANVQENRHVACIGKRNIASGVSHCRPPFVLSASTRRRPSLPIIHRPRPLWTQSEEPKSSIASYLPPRILIEIGCTPADRQPGFVNSIAP
jgi:hypothetical protein